MDYCRRCGMPEHLHGPKPDPTIDDGFGGESWYHWHPFESAANYKSETQTVVLPPDNYRDMILVPNGVRLVDVFPGGITVSMRGNEITILTPFDERLENHNLVRVAASAS